jgi:hypothetical protein
MRAPSFASCVSRACARDSQVAAMASNISRCSAVLPRRMSARHSSACCRYSESFSADLAGNANEEDMPGQQWPSDPVPAPSGLIIS